MNGVPVKSSKPAVGVSANRSPASQVTRGQVQAPISDSASKIRADMVIGQGNLKGDGGSSSATPAGKGGQMQRTHTTVTNPVANIHGAPENKGVMKLGPQDSDTNLAGKKKKSAAQVMYPNFFPLKE